MRKVEDLSVAELSKVVVAVQEILFLDVIYSDECGEDVNAWNPQKEWEVEDLDAIAFLFRAHGLVPEEQTAQQIKG